MLGILILSYLGTFGGIGILKFPIDMLAILPFSVVFLVWSQKSIFSQETQVDVQEIELML